MRWLCLIDKTGSSFVETGENVAVEPQVFHLLLRLMENRDRVVTDEIIEKIGKSRIISDSAISSRIKSARRGVGEDGKLQSHPDR